MSMLDLAIDMLGPDLDFVEGQLQELGSRHVAYGVMPKHYPLMGRALLDTIEHFLGSTFDEKQHKSWDAIYTFMSVSMMQGAFQDLVEDQKNYRALKRKVRRREEEEEKRLSLSNSTTISSTSRRSDRTTESSSSMGSSSKKSQKESSNHHHQANVVANHPRKSRLS